MLTLQLVNEFVHQYFPKVKVSKHGTRFIARCALCGDSKLSPSKRRFYLDWTDGDAVWHCFNCGRAGTFVGLYCELKGMSYSDAKKELFGFDPERIKTELTAQKVYEKKKDVPVTNMDWILKESIAPETEPEGYVETQYHAALLEFIRKRKIPEGIDLFVAKEGRYKGRVIIPIYHDGHIIYFQGRALMNIEPKYLNPIVEKSMIVLNEENFDRNMFIIITEGLLDAFMIGSQGTSVLGASVTEDFIKKVEGMTDKGIIIVLDNDVTGREKLIELLEENFTNYCRFFIMPDKYKWTKDLNQLVVEQNVENVYQFVIDNSYDKFGAKVRLGIK